MKRLQRSDGAIFHYREHLAKRPDMTVIEDGPAQPKPKTKRTSAKAKAKAAVGGVAAEASLNAEE